MGVFVGGGAVKWDAEKEAKLRQMAFEGASYSDAATHFGVTRNAIAGACNRFRIKFWTENGSLNHRARSSAGQKARWACMSEIKRREIAAAISAGHRARRL